MQHSKVALHHKDLPQLAEYRAYVATVYPNSFYRFELGGVIVRDGNGTDIGLGLTLFDAYEMAYHTAKMRMQDEAPYRDVAARRVVYTVMSLLAAAALVFVFTAIALGVIATFGQGVWAREISSAPFRNPWAFVILYGFATVVLGGVLYEKTTGDK